VNMDWPTVWVDREPCRVPWTCGYVSIWAGACGVIAPLALTLDDDDHLGAQLGRLRPTPTPHHRRQEQALSDPLLKR
jgi:hypothetical protein